MPTKRLFVDIQGELFDCWHVISAEKGQEYNDARGELDYLLILNRTAFSTNIQEKVFKYDNKEERDEMLYKLKDAIKANPNMYFLGEDDGTINDDDRVKGDEEQFEEDEEEES